MAKWKGQESPRVGKFSKTPAFRSNSKSKSIIDLMHRNRVSIWLWLYFDVVERRVVCRRFVFVAVRKSADKRTFTFFFYVPVVCFVPCPDSSVYESRMRISFPFLPFFPYVVPRENSRIMRGTKEQKKRENDNNEKETKETLIFKNYLFKSNQTLAQTTQTWQKQVFPHYWAGGRARFGNGGVKANEIP